MDSAVKRFGIMVVNQLEHEVPLYVVTCDHYGMAAKPPPP